MVKRNFDGQCNKDGTFYLSLCARVVLQAFSNTNFKLQETLKEDIDVLGQFFEEVITQCLNPYVKCSCRVIMFLVIFYFFSWPNFFEVKSLFILAMRCKRQQETVSVPKYSLKYRHQSSIDAKKDLAFEWKDSKQRYILPLNFDSPFPRLLVYQGCDFFGTVNSNQTIKQFANQKKPSCQTHHIVWVSLRKRGLYCES